MTAEPMDELYAKLLAGHGVAHALRLARWLVCRRSVVEDPFLWGVFMVVGVG
jgi:CHAT domain-containing protein